MSGIVCPKCRLEFTGELEDGTCPECHGAVLRKAPNDYGTYRLYEQKRLDRPELRLDNSARKVIFDVLYKEAPYNQGLIADGVLDGLQKLGYALITDIEEPDKIREEITRLNKKLDDREEDLIEAKKQERERIATVASFTVILDGNRVVVDKYDWDRLWQALKETKG